MDNMFFWEYNDENGFFDEDDIMVNKNDPFSEYHDDNRLFYGEDAKDCCESHVFEEDVLDEYNLDKPPETITKDSFNTSDAIAGGAIFGGMAQDEVISDADVEEILKVGDMPTETEAELISLQQANNMKRQGTFRDKIQPRPFEQWVDDILNGRKTYSDPL